MYRNKTKKNPFLSLIFFVLNIVLKVTLNFMYVIRLYINLTFQVTCLKFYSVKGVTYF